MSAGGKRPRIKSVRGCRQAGRHDVMGITTWVQEQKETDCSYPYSHGGVVGRRA
jgi:hypothetical protein